MKSTYWAIRSGEYLDCVEVKDFNGIANEDDGCAACAFGLLKQMNEEGKRIGEVFEATNGIDEPRFYATSSVLKMAESFMAFDEIGNQGKTELVVKRLDSTCSEFDNALKQLTDEATQIVSRVAVE